ncbi:coq-3 [Pristionchus pacificus]|uniref:Ubiquinone biosynthesis O-methyltransferase, mitochondrial n=1 Tax=Pristionchus pacificus TaxID=54126 RepID=A0A454Y446_PRIPA|nr:coq-3 [Pristionchus pacificus]|eukprot:PDM70529.1 coq-3 [Pristionchus pacificus]
MVARSVARLHSAATTAAASASASNELARFARLAHEWSDEKGAFRALHSMNELRVPWIVEETTKGVPLPAEAARAPQVLDVGCGGGILSMALARRGLRVRGVDACVESIDVAKKMAEQAVIPPAVRARLQFDVVEETALGEGKECGAYDAVVASEVVEHVPSVPAFVRSLVAAAKPGAPIFLTTINRTTLSRVAAIWLAEEVLRVVPSGMHDWRQFVKPEELTAELEANGCKVHQVLGMDYNPLLDRWKWTECTQINYAVLARRIL